MTPKVCELPGCEQVIPRGPDSGSPRLYCCSEHRVAAQRIRRQARKMSAPDAKDQAQHDQVSVPSTAAQRSKGQNPRPKSTKRPAKRSKAATATASAAGSGKVGRRAKSARTRNAIAVLSVAALVGGMATGDIPSPLAREDLGARPATRPPGQAAPPAGQVSTAWVPKTRQMLDDIDGLLIRIHLAEHAADNAPRTIQTVQLIAMTTSIAKARQWLEGWQRTLQADVNAAETYEQAIRDRQSALTQLGWVNRARWSLDNLTGEARLKAKEARRGLNAQATHLTRQLLKYQQIQYQVRPAVLAASERKLPVLPGWIRSLVNRILRLVGGVPTPVSGLPLAPLQAGARGVVSTSAPPHPSPNSEDENVTPGPSTSTPQPPETGQTPPSDSGATEQPGFSSADSGADGGGGDAAPVAGTSFSGPDDAETDDAGFDDAAIDDAAIDDAGFDDADMDDADMDDADMDDADMDDAGFDDADIDSDMDDADVDDADVDSDVDTADADTDTDDTGDDADVAGDADSSEGPEGSADVGDTDASSTDGGEDSDAGSADGSDGSVGDGGVGDGGVGDGGVGDGGASGF